MSIRVVRHGVLCLALLVSTNVADAGGVAILDAPGLGVMPDIQTAINAAVGGDVLLIGPGTYAPFTIDNKTLYLYALPGDAVSVTGTITIQNLGPAKRVVLSGVSSTGAQSVGVSQPGLLLNNNAGHVRFQNCSFTGGRGLSASCTANGIGGRAIFATDCARLSFTRCMIVGGTGHTGVFPATLDCRGGDGGEGIYAQGSALALFESTVIGGAGGANGSIGGNGATGLRQLNLGAVISGCTVRGGDGGVAWDTFPQHGGNGGNGMSVDPSAQAQLFENTFEGGAGGEAPVEPTLAGFPGTPVVGSGVIHYFNVASRHFAAPSVAAESSLLAVSVHGEPKDLAYIVEASAPAWQLTPRFTGLWLVPSSAFHNSSHTFLDGSGEGVITRTMQSITSPPSGRIAWLQGVAFGRFNERALATPLQVLVIDRAAQPDCDGNGTCDWLDLFEGTTGDCDGDLASDACEILAGAADCNSNSIPDACDIASGTSMDLNHNLVPDECDSTGNTLWVDAAAAPGGNGTAQAPYQSLKAAFDGALSGDSIVVRDGTYTGALNNGLNALGRTLTIISEHGSANCVIDPAQSPQYFVHCYNTTDLRLEGFTLRNARRLVYVNDLDPNTGPTPRGMLVDCVIEQCIDGAIWNQFGDLRAERCVFRSNSGFFGSAIIAQGRSQILGCSFEFNHVSGQGGAISCSVRSDVRIQDCRFVGNTAGTNGGAIFGGATDGYLQPPALEIVNCRFEQNSATQGGALYFAASMDLPAIRMRVSNSSFFGNIATVRGGSIRVSDRGRCDLRNSILWNGSAPAGAELSVGNGATLPSELVVSFCDVQGGQAAVHQNGGTFVWGAGNFALDPFFIDNDLHLAPNSPCTDAGNNALVALDVLDLDHDGNTNEPNPFDFDGLARFVDVPSAPNVGSGTPPLVDLGCYEHP